jgi:catechol 2,3-dioxygenase-like lactoylglutathione lyase family enzyme
MIKAIHALVYSTDPEATRAFFRDVLGWPSVADPASIPPWPIYRAGPAELAVHPASGVYEGEAYAHDPHHSISLMCDDIASTRAELEARGARFEGGIDDRGFGLVTNLIVPGAGTILLYEPRHPEAWDL